MTTRVPPPVLDDSDLQFVRSVARTFSTPEWEPSELESVLSDSVRLIRSIAVKYTDHKKVELNFSDLESEGRVKLIKRLQGTQRSPSILTKFAGKRGDFFRHLKSCFTGDCRVLLSDGTQRRLDEIVENKQSVEVVSVDENTGKLVNKRVVGWYKTPAEISEWRKLSVKRPGGLSRPLFVTNDHQMLTQRGWVQVGNLQGSDTLYQPYDSLTKDGISALVGMYLGDGHVRTDGAFVYGHGPDQEEYTRHVASLYGKEVYETATGPTLARPGGSTLYAVAVSLTGLLEKYTEKLPYDLKETYGRKRVTPWILENLDEIALAYWYMDDGSFYSAQKRREYTLKNPQTRFNGNGLKKYTTDRSRFENRGTLSLATQSFTRADCDSLIAKLEEKWGIKSKFVELKGRGYGTILIDRACCDLFFSIVAPRVIPLMRYKLGVSYKDIPYQNIQAVEQKLLPANFVIKPIRGKGASNNVVTRGNRGKWFQPDFDWKFDITVEDSHNFVCEGTVVHNCVNNHIKGIVYRNVCTAKRTGRKIPAKDSMPADYDRSWHPDVSLNNPDISKSVELMASDPDGARSSLRTREFDADMHELLSPTEFLVYRQMTNPNSHAVSLALIDSYRGRKIESRVDIKITQDHLAVGLGLDRKTFSEVSEKIKTKVHSYMHTEESGHANAAITTLETVFGVQIPRAMPAGVVRRLLTLVARDNHQKVTPEVESMLKSVGAKPPSFSQNGDMTCFGVLFQKNNRYCSVCGLRQSCEVEAANYDLGQVALSPKLFTEKALVRTVAATDEIPVSTTVSATVPDSAEVPEDPQTEAEPVSNAPASPAGSEPMSIQDEELKSYLEGNFKPAIYRDELYYQHKVRDGNKLKSIFWLGRINGRLELRFCKASPKLAKHLVAGKRKTH